LETAAELEISKYSVERNCFNGLNSGPASGTVAPCTTNSRCPHNLTTSAALIICMKISSLTEINAYSSRHIITTTIAAEAILIIMVQLEAYHLADIPGKHTSKEPQSLFSRNSTHLGS
jgi:hypothetical protein